MKRILIYKARFRLSDLCIKLCKFLEGFKLLQIKFQERVCWVFILLVNGIKLLTC